MRGKGKELGTHLAGVVEKLTIGIRHKDINGLNHSPVVVIGLLGGSHICEEGLVC